MTEREHAWKVSNNNTSTKKGPSEWHRDSIGTAKNSLGTQLPDAWWQAHPASQEQGLFDEAEVSLLKEKDAKQNAKQI